MADDRREVAEAVRRAVIAAMIDAYEDAGVRGLCAEGRFEAAIGAARAIDLSEAFDLAPPLSREET